MTDKPISPLRQRMIEDMTARHFAEKAQRTISVLPSLPRRLGVSRPEPECRAAGNRRPLHDDEPGALQCLHERPGDDASHHLASVIHPLAPAVAQREGDSFGDVVGLRGRECSASVMRAG